MEKLENDDFSFDFQQNNDFQHVSIQVMTNVARAAMSGAIFFHRINCTGNLTTLIVVELSHTFHPFERMSS
jgi:hypothetical protein